MHPKIAKNIQDMSKLWLAGLVWAMLVVAFPEHLMAQDKKTNANSITEFTGDSSFDSYIKEKRDRYNVFVFGDSFAEGMTAGLNRILTGKKNFKLQPRSRAGTGLARPDRYDWNLALSKVLEGKRVDIAVIFIGANDTSRVTTNKGRFKFGTPEWRKAYVAYVDRFIKQLKDHGTAVYWIGLPPMWKASYDQSSTVVSAIHRERVLAAGMKFINIRSQFVDKQDKFTLKGFDVKGQFRSLRSRDGVHFLRRGNDKLAGFVFGAIEKDVQRVESGGLNSFSEELDGNATEVRSTALNLPIFAQESETGASIPVDLGPKITLVRRERPPEQTQAQLERSIAVPGSAQNNGFSPKVTPGSGAAQVLVAGESLASKPGRADDFSWPVE